MPLFAGCHDIAGKLLTGVEQQTSKLCTGHRVKPDNIFYLARLKIRVRIGYHQPCLPSKDGQARIRPMFVMWTGLYGSDSIFHKLSSFARILLRVAMNSKQTCSRDSDW